MSAIRTKRIAAILLLICFVLPLSRCTNKEIHILPDGETIIKEQTRISYDYLIPVKKIKLSEPSSFIFMLPFFWPFPFWLIKDRLNRRHFSFIWDITEIGLLISSFCLLFYWTFYLTSAYWGGLLAISSVIVLVIIYLCETFSIRAEAIKEKFNLFLQRTRFPRR